MASLNSSNQAASGAITSSISRTLIFFQLSISVVTLPFQRYLRETGKAPVYWANRLHWPHSRKLTYLTNAKSRREVGSIFESSTGTVHRSVLLPPPPTSPWRRHSCTSTRRVPTPHPPSSDKGKQPSPVAPHLHDAALGGVGREEDKRTRGPEDSPPPRCHRRSRAGGGPEDGRTRGLTSITLPSEE